MSLALFRHGGLPRALPPLLGVRPRAQADPRPLARAKPAALSLETLAVSPGPPRAPKVMHVRRRTLGHVQVRRARPRLKLTAVFSGDF